MVGLLVAGAIAVLCYIYWCYVVLNITWEYIAWWGDWCYVVLRCPTLGFILGCIVRWLVLRRATYTWEHIAWWGDWCYGWWAEEKGARRSYMRLLISISLILIVIIISIIISLIILVIVIVMVVVIIQFVSVSSTSRNHKISMSQGRDQKHVQNQNTYILLGQWAHRSNKNKQN